MSHFFSTPRITVTVVFMPLRSIYAEKRHNSHICGLNYTLFLNFAFISSGNNWNKSMYLEFSIFQKPSFLKILQDESVLFAFLSNSCAAWNSKQVVTTKKCAMNLLCGCPLAVKTTLAPRWSGQPAPVFLTSLDLSVRKNKEGRGTSLNGNQSCSIAMADIGRLPRGRAPKSSWPKNCIIFGVIFGIVSSLTTSTRIFSC